MEAAATCERAPEEREKQRSEGATESARERGRCERARARAGALQLYFFLLLVFLATGLFLVLLVFLAAGDFFCFLAAGLFLAEGERDAEREADGEREAERFLPAADFFDDDFLDEGDFFDDELFFFDEAGDFLLPLLFLDAGDFLDDEDFFAAGDFFDDELLLFFLDAGERLGLRPAPAFFDEELFCLRAATDFLPAGDADGNDAHSLKECFKSTHVTNLQFSCFTLTCLASAWLAWLESSLRVL